MMEINMKCLILINQKLKTIIQNKCRNRRNNKNRNRNRNRRKDKNRGRRNRNGTSMLKICYEIRTTLKMNRKEKESRNPRKCM